MANEAIDHPQHYTSHPSGVEAIEVVEGMSFNLGNAVKYLWRAGLKGALAEDLRKALWYLRREIARMRTLGAYGSPRPLSSKEAALRAIEASPDGVLRSVLVAMFTTKGDYVTVLQILEAASHVQRALDTESPFRVELKPRLIEADSSDPSEEPARISAAAAGHREGGAGTVTTKAVSQ